MNEPEIIATVSPTQVIYLVDELAWDAYHSNTVFKRDNWGSEIAEYTGFDRGVLDSGTGLSDQLVELNIVRTSQSVASLTRGSVDDTMFQKHELAFVELIGLGADRSKLRLHIWDPAEGSVMRVWNQLLSRLKQLGVVDAGVYFETKEEQFVRLYLAGEDSISAISDKLTIGERTAYAWINKLIPEDKRRRKKQKKKS